LTRLRGPKPFLRTFRRNATAGEGPVVRTERRRSMDGRIKSGHDKIKSVLAARGSARVFAFRHCEPEGRSNPALLSLWIASSLSLLAMTTPKK
jgi:hypothetical protein